jgi:chemotaxis signal transduction protein
MNDPTLAPNLINALNRLQRAEFDKEFLSDKNDAAPEIVTEQYFAFSIGNQRLVVKADSFCEVFVKIPIAPLPNSPRLVVGLCNIRSLLVPVYQLYTALGDSPPANKHVFCIGRGEKTLAILINGLPVSIALSQQNLISHELEDHSVLRNLTTQSYLYRQDVYHLLDSEQLGEQLLHLSDNESLLDGKDRVEFYPNSKKSVLTSFR